MTSSHITFPTGTAPNCLSLSQLCHISLSKLRNHVCTKFYPLTHKTHIQITPLANTYKQFGSAGHDSSHILQNATGTLRVQSLSYISNTSLALCCSYKATCLGTFYLFKDLTADCAKESCPWIELPACTEQLKHSQCNVIMSLCSLDSSGVHHSEECNWHHCQQGHDRIAGW